MEIFEVYLDMCGANQTQAEVIEFIETNTTENR